MFELMIRKNTQFESNGSNTRTSRNLGGRRIRGVMLTQRSDRVREKLVPYVDDRTINTKCYKYNAFDHMVLNCTQEEENDNIPTNQSRRGFSILQLGIFMVHKPDDVDDIVKRSWILINMCSTDNFSKILI